MTGRDVRYWPKADMLSTLDMSNLVLLGQGPISLHVRESFNLAHVSYCTTLTKTKQYGRSAMLKIAATFCAVFMAVSAFSTSAEARGGFGGGGVHMGGFGGGGMRVGGGFAGARIGAANFGGARMGFAGPGRIGIAGPGRGVWAGRWAGGRWAGWRGGRWWPWWGVGAGVALAAAWPYWGGYGYGYDSCVQWVPDWGWVNVCSSPYAGYYGY